MKKAKLFASIASICFAFAVLIFGIYAAEQVNYQINGTLTYEVNDCYVTVETSVYYSPTTFTQDQLYSKMETIVASGSTEGLTSVPYNNLNYNSYLDTADGANQKQINLVFEGKRNNSPKQAYFIVMNVTNIGGKAINIGVNTPITLPSNVYSINSGLWTSVGTGTNNAKRLVVAFSLEDKLSPVTPRNGQETTSYSMSLKAEIDDEDTTELNVYDFNQSTGTITKTSRTEELAIDLCVPSYVNGHKVTKALDFSDCTQLTSISIPSTVQEMGEAIFANCPKLTSLTLPFVGKKNYASREDLIAKEGDNYWLNAGFYYLFDDEDFEGAVWIQIDSDNEPYHNYFSRAIPSNLTSLNFLYGCRYIGCYAFDDAEANNLVIEDIYFPNSITMIDDFAFHYNRNLKNVKLPTTIEYIGRLSFDYCRGITEITIPSKVSFMGDSAFGYCNNLSSVTIEYGATYVRGFDYTAITSLELPDTVTSIGGETQYSGFCNGTQIRSIKIPEGVTIIPDSAFSDCENLVSVTLPNTLKTIRDSAFYSSRNLSKINFPNSLEGKIGNNAFQYTAITKAVIPSGVTEIGSSCFYDCENLKEVVLPEGLESIGPRGESWGFSFYGCSSLTEITIPSTVTYICRESFGECPALKTVYIEGARTELYQEYKSWNGQTAYSEAFFYGKDINNKSNYYFYSDDTYFIYVPDNYYDWYMNDETWVEYSQNGILRRKSELPSEYRVVYHIADGVVDDTYSGDMPYANMLNKLNPDVWHQFNAQVVSRDNMGSYANNIYTNIDGATNAIYSDIDLVPSDGIEYSIRAPSGYKIYIYKYAIDSDEFVSTSPRVCEFRRSEDKDNYLGIIFGKDVYKIRFILVRFESVGDDDVQNGDREYFDTAVKLIPSQITTSKFTNLYLTATNVDNSQDGSCGAKKLVGYYRPGVAIEMPSIVMSPYKDYDFMGWLADPNNEDSTISSIPSEQVVEYGRTTVFAHWNKKVRYLYFNINFDGNDQYIKVDGISVNSYGEELSIRDILDAAFGTQAIKNLMTSKGIEVDQNGYPTNYIFQKLCMKSGTRGCFKTDNHSSIDWITKEQFYDSETRFRFTSGDAYIYIEGWSNDYRVTYQVDDGNIGNNRGSDNIPLVNLLNRLDPSVWHQFDASVVSRDNMGSSANSIYTVCDDATNAIYSDVAIIPSDEIEYSVRAVKGYEVYIYCFEYGEDYFTSNDYAYRFKFENSSDIFKEITFDKSVCKIRFIIVRYDYNENNARYDIPTKLSPNQINTNKFDNTRFTPINSADKNSGKNSSTFVGCYKPGYAIEMPFLMLVPYADYDFMDWLTDDQDEDSTITGIPSNEVVEGESTIVFAHWNKKIRYLYFKLNYDGTEDYIKVDGISVDSYGTEFSISALLDYTFGTQAIKNLMTSKGITIDEDGYPTSCDVQQLCMEHKTKGCFIYTSHQGTVPYINREDFYVSNSRFRFTSGDAYIYVGEWNVASVNQDVNISNACVCDNDIQNVESASNYTISMWMQKYNLYFDRVKQSFVSFAKSKVA